MKNINKSNLNKILYKMLLIRETDLIRLKVSDIDFVNNTITTKSKKGMKVIYFYILSSCSHQIVKFETVHELEYANKAST